MNNTAHSGIDTIINLLRSQAKARRQSADACVAAQLEIDDETACLLERYRVSSGRCRSAFENSEELRQLVITKIRRSKAKCKSTVVDAPGMLLSLQERNARLAWLKELKARQHVLYAVDPNTVSNFDDGFLPAA